MARNARNRRIAMAIAATIAAGQIPVEVFANSLENIVTIEQAQKEQNQEVREVKPYIQDYNDDAGLTWTRLIGNGDVSKNKEDGTLNIKRGSANNQLVFIEEQSPSLTDGEAEIRFMLNPSAGDSAAGRFGLVFRGKSDTEYGFIGYNNNGKWLIETPTAWKDDISGPTINPGEWVNMMVRVVGNKITLIVNGETIFDESVNMGNWPTEEGKFGYRTWYDNKDIKVDYLKCGPVGSLGESELPEMVIESVENVALETYPRIKPILPDTLKVKYTDGSSSTKAVAWDYFSKESYSEPGEFTVLGQVEGTDIKAEAHITVKGEATVYETNFDTPETSGDWKVLQGSGTPVLENGGIKVPMNGVSTAVDMNSPDEKDFVYETDFTVNTDQGRIGLLFRYSSESEWGAICYDAGSWIWKNGAGQYGGFPGSFSLKEGVKYRLKLKVEDSNVALWVDDELVGKAAIPNLPSKAGKIGLSGWFGNKNVTLDNVKVQGLMPMAPPVVEESYAVIQSDVMEATIDTNFPRVASYKWKADDEILVGEEEQLYVMEINGDKYIPEVTSTVNADSVDYKLKVEELGMEISLRMSIEGNKLKMQVTDIKEGDVKLQYLNFPNQSLASVNSREGGQTASVVTTGDWNNIVEEFKDVNDLTPGSKGKTYAFINNDKFAVTVNNNTIEGGNRVVLATENRGDETGSYKKTGISNGTWTYREVLSETTDLGADYFQEELPWSEVIIARDENSDEKIDWQDAAVLYRENMKIPVGGEDIKNNMSYIDFNIGYTQNPFLRSLDTIKKLYNYTDGFGQLVLHKGYQAEGHDDSQPDYAGHIGIRQGGTKDFNKLVEDGKNYNAKVGIHINATEYVTDSFEFPEEIVNQNAPGWGWLDQAYYVDQRADITTGELFRRLDNLKAEVPQLGWVYVDVYTGNGWNAHQIGEKINSLNYMIATEMNGPLEQHVPWTHWGGDPAYPNKGNESKIMRFMKNDTQDSFLADPLVKGNKHLLAGGWGTKHTIEGEYGTEVFYNQVLPTKYMQHFKIMTMNENEVTFEENLRAVREGADINYYKDGRLVATTPENSIGETGIGKTNLFLPWNPVEEDDKIYHWNPLGTTSTWELPSKWAGLSKVYLYELTDLGRSYVKEVPVIDGQVTLDVKKDTPYLVFQEIAEEDRITNWGDGAQIKDPGLDSQTWDYWTKASSNENTDHITIMNEQIGTRKGNDLIKVNGNNGADATIKQEITGLESGKTYSVSAWVKNDNNRNVELEVDCNGEKVENVITRAGRQRQGEGVKWINDTFVRMEVEFTVPEGVSTATINMNVAEGLADSTVLIDDFRIWEHPGHTNKDGYVFYEDFENVDEGITPFFLAPGRGHSNRSHLAERDLFGRQYMTWVIDGRFSLKTNQQPDERGEMLITEESTFKLEPNKEYELGFIYALADAAPNYSVTVKSATQGEAVRIPLTATGSETGKIKQTFTTGDANDYYMAIEKQQGYKELIIDNIYVTEIDSAVENVALQSVNLTSMVNELEVNQSVDLLMNALMNNNSVASLEDATIEYKVENEKIISIENGKATALKPGTTKVNATVTIDGNTVTSNDLTIKVNGEGEVVVDKSGLEASINEAAKLNEKDYTETSWEKVEEALKVAKKVLANEDATQEEVNQAKNNLEKSIKELVEQEKEIVVQKIKNLRGVATKNEVKLTWDAPSSEVGLIGYVIYKDGKVFTEVPVGTTEFIVDGLRANTNYGFKVVTKYSNGEVSKPVSENVRTKK